MGDMEILVWSAEAFDVICCKEVDLNGMLASIEREDGVEVLAVLEA